MNAQSFPVGLIAAWSTALLGWGKWLFELRQKWKEKAAKEKAEAELALIRRRAAAPFLSPSMVAFSNLYRRIKENELICVPAGNGNLLCFNREEVPRDLPAGTRVYFVIGVGNESANRAKVRLDGIPIEIAREPDYEGANDLMYLAYDYDPSKHGSRQTLEVWFETTSGVQDTHRYEIVHGRRTISRVDPP